MKKDQPEPSVVLEVNGLTVSFQRNGRTVEPVRGVGFTLDRGERLGIIGESGSGKSLTALALMRLVRPPGQVSGSVRLNDVDLSALSEREMSGVRGRKISLIYQNPLSALNPLQTIGDQVIESIRLHQKISRTEARTLAGNLLDDVGIADARRRLGSYPHEFSGGMRQRVVIALALASDPSVVIADEPTTALDVTTQQRIVELLLSLADARDTAVVFITHDLAVAKQFCTRIAVMYAGRIVETQPSEDFYSDPSHPYARGLLNSVCGLDLDVNRPIPAIPGQPPMPGALPSGCAFSDRCPEVTAACVVDEPELRDIGGQVRRVACIRRGEALHVTGGDL